MNTVAILKRLTAASLLAVALPAGSWAADIAPPEPVSDWTFTGALYLWGSGIAGDAGVLGQPPQEFDLTFSDILENLEFAAMGLGEARNGPFVFGMDLTYSKLGATVDLPEGLPARELDITSAMWMVTGFGGYSVVEDDNLVIDVIAGARLWSIDADFDYKGDVLDGTSDGDGATWVDPLVGAKLLFDVTPEIYVSAWGMVGGFNLGSDMMWDVMGGAGYKFTDSFSAFAGYRAVSVDYSDDGFVYDVVQQGPILAAVFRF